MVGGDGSETGLVTKNKGKTSLLSISEHHPGLFAGSSADSTGSH